MWLAQERRTLAEKRRAISCGALALLILTGCLSGGRRSVLLGTSPKGHRDLRGTKELPLYRVAAQVGFYSHGEAYLLKLYCSSSESIAVGEKLLFLFSMPLARVVRDHGYRMTVRSTSGDSETVFMKRSRTVQTEAEGELSTSGTKGKPGDGQLHVRPGDKVTIQCWKKKTVSLPVVAPKKE